MNLEQYPEMFRALPMSCLVLDKDFIIREMTDEYLALTGRVRENIHRKDYFDVFEETPQDQERLVATAAIVRASLERVRDNKVTDHMPISRYDLPDSTGKLVTHYWTSWSVPLLNKNGDLMFILHRLEDITRYVGVLDTVNAMGDSLHDLSNLMGSMLNGSLDERRNS